MARIPHPARIRTADLPMLLSGEVILYRGRDEVHHMESWCGRRGEKAYVTLSEKPKLCRKCGAGRTPSAELRNAALHKALRELEKGDGTFLDDAWNWQVAKENLDSAPGWRRQEEIVTLLHTYEKAWIGREVNGGKLRGASIVHEEYARGAAVAATRAWSVATRDGWHLVAHPWDQRGLLEGYAQQPSVKIRKGDDGVVLETMLALWTDGEGDEPLSELLEKARLLHS